MLSFLKIYENLIFKFVRGEVSQLQRKHQRSAIDLQDRKELDEKGVLLLDSQKRGLCYPSGDI